MQHEAHGKTDVGRVRKHNEDAILIDKELGLYVVCDGCGGHAAGEVAAQTSCQEIGKYMRENREALEACRNEANLFNRDRAVTLAKMAVHHANQVVFSMAMEDPEKRGMACTIVLVIMLGNHAVVASAGDSRVYLVRQGHMFQITEDHTIGVEYLKKGLITAEQLNSSRRNAMITRVIGQQNILEPDTLFMELMNGDRFVLCSDGLTLNLNDDQLLKINNKRPAAELPEAFVQVANERGGQDNITALVIETQGSDDAADEEVKRKFEVLGGIPLFEHLTYLDMMKLLNITSAKAFNTDEVVIQEGEIDTSLFVCLSGTVRVAKQDQVIAELGEGDFFGELSLIDKNPRSASVVASAPCQFLQIDRNDYFKLLNREPHMAIRLLWPMCRVLSHRLRNTSAELAFARCSLPEAPADALHMLASEASE